MTSVHLTNAWHTASGGVRRHYLDLFEAAETIGWRMRLIVPGEQTRIEPVGRFGRIYHLRSPPAPAFDRRYRLLLPSHYLPPGRGAIARVLRRERPDIVETADKFCLPYLSALVRKRFLRDVGRPTLIGHSTERMDVMLASHVSGRPVARAFAAWYMRAIYAPPFDFHVANSSYTADEIRQALPPHRSHVLHVASPGVDAALFGAARRSDAARAGWLYGTEASPETQIVGYAGRLSKEKHTGALIEMMAVLSRTRGRDVRLLIAGDGPDKPWLQARAATEAPGRIVFVGHLEARPLLATFLASLDVFVHPNPTEPFGIGPLEAMAAGTPVVVPRGGGAMTYATDGNAWLAGDGGCGLARAVAAALDERRPERIQEARDTALRFDARRQAHRHFALFRRLHRQRVEGARRRAALAPAPQPDAS